jgi:hypothetical protein
MEKVKEEGKDYDFRKISTVVDDGVVVDYYAVIHAGKMYIIVEKDGKFACSCEDMSFRRTDGTICKHLIRFSQLMMFRARQMMKARTLQTIRCHQENRSRNQNLRPNEYLTSANGADLGTKRLRRRKLMRGLKNMKRCARRIQRTKLKRTLRTVLNSCLQNACIAERRSRTSWQ